MKEMKGQWLNPRQWAMPNGTVLEDQPHTERAQLEELEATLIGVLGKEPLPSYVMTRVAQGDPYWVLTVRRGNDWINVVIGHTSSLVEHTYNSGRTETITRVRNNRFYYQLYLDGGTGGPDRSSYVGMFEMLHRLLSFCERREFLLERPVQVERLDHTTDVVQ